MESEEGRFDLHTNNNGTHMSDADKVAKLFRYIPSLNLALFKPPVANNDAKLSDEQLVSLKNDFRFFQLEFQQKAESRLQMVSNSLIEKLHILRKSVLTLVNEQRGSLATVIRNTDKTNLKSTDDVITYLNHLPSICLESRDMLVSWIQIKVAMMSHESYHSKLNYHLITYEYRSKQVLDVFRDIAQLIRSFVENGFLLLAELESPKIPSEFYLEFLTAMDNFNLFCTVLQCHCNSIEKTCQLSHKFLLQLLGRCNGIQLARGVACKIAKHCNTTSKLLKFAKTPNPMSVDGFLASVSTETVDIKRPHDSNVQGTSDRFGSSNLSGLHDHTGPHGKHLKPLDLIQTAPKLGKKIKSYFDDFLEQRFRIFVCFVHNISARNQLSMNVASSLEPLSESDSVHDEWSEICAFNKMPLWRAFLSLMWTSFTNELYRIVSQGIYRLPSIVQCDLTTGCQLVDFVVDILRIVPASSQLTSTSVFTNTIQHVVLYNVWMITMQSCRHHISMDKSLIPFLNSPEIDQLLRYSKVLGQNYLIPSQQLSISLAYCKTLSCISSFNVHCLLAIYDCYQRSSETDNQFATFIELLLSSKARFISTSNLEETFPDKKSWKRMTTGKAANKSEYMSDLLSSTLEQLIQTSNESYKTSLFFKEALITSTLASWLEFVRMMYLKHGLTDVNQFKNDIESAKEWILSKCCKSDEETTAIFDLIIFRQTDAIMKILTVTDESNTNGLSVTFKRNVKVRPIMSSEKPVDLKSDEDGQVSIKIVPDAYQWEKLRKRNPLTCCFMCL